MVLRRSSMIGDTMSHASLAGITLGLLTNTNPILEHLFYRYLRCPLSSSCENIFSPSRSDSNHHLVT